MNIPIYILQKEPSNGIGKEIDDGTIMSTICSFFFQLKSKIHTQTGGGDMPQGRKLYH